MPKPRKSHLGRSPRNTRVQQELRSTETAEQHQVRLQADKVRHVVSRASETASEQQARLQSQQVRQADLRSSETASQHQARLRSQQVRQAYLRSYETADLHQARLQSQQVRQADLRSSETASQHQARLQSQQVRQADLRSSETAGQHQARLQVQQLRQYNLRSSETAEHRQTRLQAERSAHAAATSRAWQAKVDDAFSYDPSIAYETNQNLAIGRMAEQCPHCNALKWKRETPGMCCSNGKVRLPPIPEPPEPLLSLLKGDTPNSKAFLKHIRLYNSLFAMTSFAAHEVDEAWMPSFKIQGQVYHNYGSLLPPPGQPSYFLQIYFLGSELQEMQQRQSVAPNATAPDTILILQRMLHSYNSYIRSFKTAVEQQRQVRQDFQIVIRADKRPPGQHAGRFNEPSSDEVAVLMVGEGGNPRDIILRSKDDQLHSIQDTHRSYDPLQYPLLFCRGEDGYDFSLMQVNPANGAASTRKVSCNDYYAYRIMFHAHGFNSLLRSQRLMQQYIVDMFAKVENERLRFIRLNQNKLRAEEYGLLRDAVANDNNITPENLGKLVVLPSSFTGGPRYMHEYAQDAMTYVRNRGTPDLFITFTCNPNWSDITMELLPGQTPVDRVDLVARVFRQKVIKMMEVIVKVAVFGKVACYMYSIEWQKRGLPHMHLLVWLETKIRPNQIDSIISAEIPDIKIDQKLFEIVTSHMVHGPFCNRNPNSPCRKNGKCSKRYPRQLLKETQTGDDGYPLYRRRKAEDGGHTTQRKCSDGTMEVLDNTWIVPYCPLLSRLFEAHINVEYCNSVKSIKYICKYVTKGSDAAMFAIIGLGQNQLDEVTTYQQGRYISSSEAVWRLLNFAIHERFPTVIHLAVHLESGQRVYFRGGQPLQQLAQVPPVTTLSGFFTICQTDILAKTLLYCEMPRHFIWTGHEWKPRKQGKPVPNFPGYVADSALGRVYTVHPNNQEAFHLRQLLHHVCGPTSFEDLKLIRIRDDAGNITATKQCSTFVEACNELGLLEDDSHWNLAMEEAALSRSPTQLRNLFAILVASCGVNSPIDLWNEYKDSMTEDFLHQARMQNPGMNYCDELYNQTLLILEDKVQLMNGNSLAVYGLPTPLRNQAEATSKEVLREINYDVNVLAQYVAENEQRLTNDQMIAYVAIKHKLMGGQGGVLFLDAPGGTGKTFLLNLLLAFVRKEKKIALAVASSGIAATLLQGGRTAHSAFKLPLDLGRNEGATCNISKGSGQGYVLRECKLIVWDEATMSHRNAFKALDTTLQDLRGNKKLMGGVTLVLSGDFRQTLPIVTRGTPADEIKACLKNSYVWPQVHKFQLTTNMRSHIQGDQSPGQFAQQLLMVGDGKVLEDQATGLIALPCGTIVKTVDELRDRVYPNLQENFKNYNWLCQRAILAARNDRVDVINSSIQRLIPGPEHSYKSIDTVLLETDAVQYPAEFLNSIQTPGLQVHNLILKVGSPIMLIRNIDAPRLCNGTRLIVKQLLRHVIQATVMTGCAKGEDVFIPRIPIIPSEGTIQFKRTQFPVKLCFAMTINKAQGQSLGIAGIDLQVPCFSHGQLYVACSRVGKNENLFILAPDGKTKNVVYKQALK